MLDGRSPRAERPKSRSSTGFARAADVAQALLPARREAGMGTDLPGRVEALLHRLTATARSIVLYDAGNDTVKRSFEALRTAFAETLAAEACLRLEVRPFEILWDGQRVYRDEDREKSLAFRLYRDGVRSLTLLQGLDADELSRLLGILSQRFASADQHEDDIVTLLWKARLRHFDFVAVEGLTADIGAPETAPGERAAASRFFMPDDESLPAVPWSGATPPEWVDPDPAELAALEAETGTATLGRDVFAVLAALEAALAEPQEQLCLREIERLCEETRDFLVGSLNLPALLAFVRQLRRLGRSPAPWDPERASIATTLLASCGSERTVRRLIHGIPADERVARKELLDVLELACDDPFTAVAEALTGEERPAGRAVARQLLEHFGRQRGEHLRARFAEAQGRVAADLLRSLARLEAEPPLAFLAQQCDHPDPEVRAEALWHLERAPFSPPLGAALVDAVRRSRGEERARVLAVVERSRDRRFVEPLFAFVQSGLKETAEAVDVARVLGRLERRAAVGRWQPWLRPQGRLMRRRLSGSTLLQSAAAAAVAEVPGAEAAQLLELARSAAAGEVRGWIERLLAERAAGVPVRRAS